MPQYIVRVGHISVTGKQAGGGKKVADKTVCTICFKVKGTNESTERGRNWFCAWEIGKSSLGCC